MDHAVLLNKLSNLGILDKEHGWFTDYLSSRTQVVEFQGVTSTPEVLSTGVPQGSILGPLSFILHINDLPEVVSECNILMYTDDTVLYCSSSQASIIQDKLNDELTKIDHWLSLSSLFVNVTKTEAMLFGTTPRLSAVNSFSITLNNNIIKRVFHFTYLGIVFDDRLSWNEQIKYLISKAGKCVGMLGRLHRREESANVVYCSLIRPILEYCASVWGCCGEGHKDGLEALQNRVARIVATTLCSQQAMDVLKWPTLEERRRKSVFKLVTKWLQGRCPQYFKQYFKRNNTIHARTTRQSNLLHPPAVRTEIAKRSLYYYGCTLFNELC